MVTYKYSHLYLSLQTLKIWKFLQSIHIWRLTIDNWRKHLIIPSFIRNDNIFKLWEWFITFRHTIPRHRGTTTLHRRACRNRFHVSVRLIGWSPLADITTVEWDRWALSGVKGTSALSQSHDCCFYKEGTNCEKLWGCIWHLACDRRHVTCDRRDAQLHHTTAFYRSDLIRRPIRPIF